MVGGTEEIVFRLPGDLLDEVAGVAVARDGTPAVGVRIDAYAAVHARDGGVASVGIGQRGETDERGAFRFATMPRDGVSLQFSGAAWIAQSVDRDPHTDAKHLRIVLKQRCHVRVELADPAFAEASVQLQDDAGASVAIHEDRASTHMTT